MENSEVPAETSEPSVVECSEPESKPPSDGVAPNSSDSAEASEPSVVECLEPESNPPSDGVAPKLCQPAEDSVASSREASPASEPEDHCSLEVVPLQLPPRSNPDPSG